MSLVERGRRTDGRLSWDIQSIIFEGLDFAAYYLFLAYAGLRHSLTLSL